eukprot:3143197-Pleurochrysis_carterae.AAC.1
MAYFGSIRRIGIMLPSHKHGCGLPGRFAAEIDDWNCASLPYLSPLVLKLHWKHRCFLRQKSAWFGTFCLTHGSPLSSILTRHGDSGNIKSALRSEKLSTSSSKHGFKVYVQRRKSSSGCMRG